MKRREIFGEKCEKKRLSTRKFWNLIGQMIEQDVVFKSDFEKFFQEFSSEEQKILILYLDGYRQREIASRLGISQQLVSKKLRRMRKQVVFFLEKYLI